MDEEGRVFTARIQTLHRVAIPKVVRDYLELREGDFVEIHIKKIKSVKEEK